MKRIKVVLTVEVVTSNDDARAVEKDLYDYCAQDIYMWAKTASRMIAVPLKVSATEIATYS